ncbi:succinate dehydrogenase [Halobacteriales archaeon QS_5_70_15]|nr:MAG: succinate dehydrogenase [Halobacteriales archaeon QS_5_70_15]
MYEHDVIVVGAGGAGLRAAVAAHEEGADVALVTKLHPVRSHTGAAEGGINAALRDGDDWELHAYDTMKGSDYLGDAPAIETLCQDSPEEVIQLEHWGMPFSREDDGRVSQRPFGGLSFPRTTYAGAETGHHLLHTMYEQVVRTGGDGQVFEHTTNAVANTGDGPAMAYRAGVPVEDMEFVQFHPTTLPSTGVLISEGVRGEGGILYNSEGERFMYERGYANNDGELASRDVVSRAELTEVNEGRGIEDEYVYLDMRHLGEERIVDRLENILHLAEDFEGVDGLEEPMPVKPGQHYHMGGIETNENGETCIGGLYAAGECACVSVHGSNRLGGNALPELIVFGARAGSHAAGRDLGEARIETGPSAMSEAEEGLDTPVSPGALDAADGDVAADGAAVETEAVVEGAVEREREHVRTLLERDGRNHAGIRAKLQKAMTRHVNVFRREENLKEALEIIRECREAYRDVAVSDPSRTFNTDLIHTIETRNLIDVAESITLGALAREEFRGAHWREAHQERKDEEWLKHTMIAWNDGQPELYYKPVVLEGEEKTYEPKVRSY